MAGNGGSIPKFGEWKISNGAQPYTMYFETASKKRRSNSGITPPPGASPARIDAKPGGHRTPPRTPDAKPVKSTDHANRSRNQRIAAHGGGSVPTWGQWNENNNRAGAQQYTIVFDQLREERKSAPPTPSMERPQRATPTRANRQDLHDNVPKGFTCWGLFGK